jgi:outer membrane protein TolC
MTSMPCSTPTVHRARRVAGLGVPVLVGLLLLGGCSRAKYKERADAETYTIIADKSADVPNAEESFSIDQDAGAAWLEGLPTLDGADPALGDADAETGGAVIVPLERALLIAVRNNRGYQNRKESLYLAALGLTLERHRYTPIFGGGAGADYATTASDQARASDFSRALSEGREVIGGIEAVTGTPAQLLRNYADLVESAGNLAGVDATTTDIVREQQVGGSTGFDVNLLLRGGGRLALGLTSNFLRFTTGDARAASSTVIDAAFSQPLWRGAGRLVNLERLTQAERDVLYAVRDYTQFRKDFVVDVCSAYYRVLQNRDIARNAWESYESFQQSVTRERAFAQEGRRTVAALGRLEQAELDNQNRWINAVRSYRESLDQFKIQLGLSTDTNLVLDSAELDALRATGLQHPEIAVGDAIAVALEARLDLWNERDRSDDAARRIQVAANALGPQVDLLVGGQLRSDGPDNFLSFDARRTALDAGVDVDLPLDRKAERNSYRAALIAHERALREYSLAEDNVKLEVRQGWRDLEQARRNYEVAQRSVELNQRRVEEQQLLSELGRATAQDLVDAQNDLTQSQNNLTAALVSHTVARLAFWRDMGLLYIKPNGQWEEVSDAVTAAQ